MRCVWTDSANYHNQILGFLNHLFFTYVFCFFSLYKSLKLRYLPKCTRGCIGFSGMGPKLPKQIQVVHLIISFNVLQETFPHFLAISRLQTSHVGHWDFQTHYIYATFGSSICVMPRMTKLGSDS